MREKDIVMIVNEAVMRRESMKWSKGKATCRNRHGMVF